MKTTACLTVLALGSAQAFSPPRFELGTSATESFSSCGSSCSMMRRQDYYVDTRKTNSDTRALPSAKACDHNEGEIPVTKREGATASGDAAVGGLTAAGCLDDPTSITLAITSNSSGIKTGAPDLGPNVAAKTDITPFKFDVGDRTANTTYLKVVVTDTAAPVFAHTSSRGSRTSPRRATRSRTPAPCAPTPATRPKRRPSS